MGSFKDAFLNDYDREIPYFLWLSALGEIGIRSYTKMQACFAAPSEAYQASTEKLEASGAFTKKQIAKMEEFKKIYNPWEAFEKMMRAGIRIVPREDPDFPEKLLDIPASPIAIFLKGEFPKNVGPFVSVIGARECSFYGAQVAARLGEMLALYGITLVSGMARGVDSISQEAAVKAGGQSIAVLGNGVDVVYPRESRKLYEELCEKGTILSEYAPGTEPYPVFFAQRNRIISGLSDVVCVVEAKKKSGTMITVDAALEQGREVYAVPGKITDITSRGCNELIRQGAGAIIDVEEFVKELVNIYSESRKEAETETPFNIEETRKTYENDIVIENLSDVEKRILIIMTEDSYTAEQLSNITSQNAIELLQVLIRMCSKKLLFNMGAGRFRLANHGNDIRNKLIRMVT